MFNISLSPRSRTSGTRILRVERSVSPLHPPPKHKKSSSHIPISGRGHQQKINPDRGRMEGRKKERGLKGDQSSSGHSKLALIAWSKPIRVHKYPATIAQIFLVPLKPHHHTKVLDHRRGLCWSKTYTYGISSIPL